jgi:DNA-directed RNA polymerase subunit RPC12/RpoP
MTTATLSFVCPVCGRKKEYPLDEMVEGRPLECPRCTVRLTLHGHMWKEVQEQIRKIRKGHGHGS